MGYNFSVETVGTHIFFFSSCFSKEESHELVTFPVCRHPIFCALRKHHWELHITLTALKYNVFRRKLKMLHFSAVSFICILSLMTNDSYAHLNGAVIKHDQCYSFSTSYHKQTSAMTPHFPVLWEAKIRKEIRMVAYQSLQCCC